MYRQIGLFIILAAILGTNKVVAHSMVPAYPIWKPSHVDGVVTTQLELFNKRQDVEWYEIAVFDKNWRTVPFVITIGVLLLMSTKWFRTRWGAAKPEALGLPYIKE